MDKFTNVLAKKDPPEAPAGTSSNVSHLPVNHNEAHHEEFHSALSGAMKSSPKVREFVHLYKPEEYSGMKTFLSPDKASGYALKPDGDIVSVFSTQKGRGDAIVQHALKNGGNKLDAFDGYLPKLYAKHGFQEYKREANWTPGAPDVVYMHRPAQENKLAASENYAFAMAKSEYYKQDMGVDKMSLHKSEGEMATNLYLAYDGDNAGRLVGRAILADDAHALHDVSSRISHGHEIVKDWAESHGGQIISGGGDEGTFVIPPHAVEDIEKLRADYQYATNLTMTVGTGASLSQAGKALMVGKFRGKDQVCNYDGSIEQELLAAKEHVAGGQATDEEKKLDEAYLTPEGGNMTESDDSHSDCQYCAELAQDNVQDEDHCKYCHGSESVETEPHCKYCAEADQDHADDHEHSEEDCAYCQEAEANAQASHEHSGDDCKYCLEAAAHDPNSDDHADDCQYCQESAADVGPASHPADFGDPDTFGDDAADSTSDNVDADESPDLSEVLQGGLDSHSDQIKREKVVSMVSEALEGFKACKPIIERSQEQAPQLYAASISMLKAMIEMASMLGLAPKEEQANQAMPENNAPQQNAQPSANPQSADEGPSEGKPRG